MYFYFILHEPQIKRKDLAIGILTSVVMTRSKTTLIAIEVTLLEDSLYLSEFDRVIKTIIKDTKEVEVSPQKLEHDEINYHFKLKLGLNQKRSQLKETRRDLEF